MMVVYDDGWCRFPVEIMKGTLHMPRVIRVGGLIAKLHAAQPTKRGGYVFEFWLDAGLGFLMRSDDLHAADSPDSDFTVLGLSNDS